MCAPERRSPTPTSAGSVRRNRYERRSAATSLQSGAGEQALGGTPWLWAREEFSDSVHMFCLSMRPARCRSWPTSCPARQLERNLVLLGDPQQLEQPQMGSHPEGSGHFSPGSSTQAAGRTISEQQGLFLAETWRLHPGNLQLHIRSCFTKDDSPPFTGLERQDIQAPAPFSRGRLMVCAGRPARRQSELFGGRSRPEWPRSLKVSHPDWIYLD